MSPLTAALRFLPNVLLGLVTTLTIRFIVHRVLGSILAVVANLISAIAPLLMAIVNPDWLWWWCVFWAVLLSPICADGERPLLRKRTRDWRSVLTLTKTIQSCSPLPT